MEHYVVVGVLAALNVIQIIAGIVEKHRTDARERIYLKAIIAKNIQEFSAAEDSSEDRIKMMELENDLAMKAQQLQSNEQTIPIY